LPDETKTLERLNFALETGADAAGIYSHFMGRDEETAETRALRRMVKAMERYLDAVEKTDPASEIAKHIRELLRFIQNGA
jgi:adenylosuccinate synthase